MRAIFKFRYFNGEADDGVMVSFPLSDRIYYNLRLERSWRDLLTNYANAFELERNCEIVEWNSGYMPVIEWELVFHPMDMRGLEAKLRILNDLRDGALKLVMKIDGMKAMM